MRNTLSLGHKLTKIIQRLNNDPDHDPTLNNDSGQDSGDNFPKETQIINNISRFREDLPFWRKSPILKICISCKMVHSYMNSFNTISTQQFT